ncbi:hypothetical protein [Spirosoma flavum]|uniref:Uncharacterized protein n=1 Tax=Spirosoma flavum TaxID=2048557 RepID=A0ABW6ANE8_9BACT
MKTICKFTYTALIVLFSVSSIQANQPKIIWQNGHLVLWNKMILEGDVAYNWSAEMVLLRQSDGRLHTYSANQVSQFGWFDMDQHKRRNFVSLVKPIDKDRTNRVFLEICVDGPLAVVRRLRQPHGLLKRMFSHPSYSTDQPIMAQNHDLFVYFVYDAGNLLEMDRFYSDIYQPLMTTYDHELRQYVRDHNINDRTILGRLVLIDRYNSLVQHESKTASAKGFPDVMN